MTLVMISGLLGQAIYGLRMILQWAMSERAKRSVVPRSFWFLSLAGFLFSLIYGVFKPEPVYLLGILPNGFIFARNLLIRRPASTARLGPLAAAALTFIVWAAWTRPHFGDPAWATFGMTGSIVYGSRFVVQWWVSERRGISELPQRFWWVSLVGSLMILVYAWHRLDPVMIFGFTFSPIPYVRNLILLRRSAASRTNSSEGLDDKSS